MLQQNLNNADFYRSTREVIDLVNAFETCVLPISGWTKISYLTVAFWYCYLHPASEARHQLETSVRRYGFENNQEIFDETAMLMNLNAVQDFLKLHPHRHSFLELLNQLIEQFNNSTWLVKLYSRQLLRAAREKKLRPTAFAEKQNRVGQDFF